MTGIARGDVEAIRRQGDALRSFEAEAAGVTQQADRAAAATHQEIRDECARRRAALSAAEAELTACTREPEADCSGEARAVELAAAALADAERASRMAERAIREFHGPRARFRREVESHVTGGRRLLTLMAEDLAAYLAVASGGTAGVSLGGGGGSPTTADAPASSGLPDGWAMVPLAAIDVSGSGVTGPESFGKGYSPEDLTWAFEALHEVVLPAVGQGLGTDYFRSRDQAEGRMGTRSYADTYSGFFGRDNAIKLEPRGDGTYEVGNGYHRVWVAQRLGLDSVPGLIR